ncbi:MAG: eCIS core domain-containing protein [bacterium]
MPEHTQTAKQKHQLGAQVRSRAQRRQGPSGQLPSRHVIDRAQTDPSSLTPTEVLALQRALGNRAVTQLLGRGRCATAPPGSTVPGLTAIVQRTMEVGAADDALEREAEDFAEKMVRRADTPAYRPAGDERAGDREEPLLPMQGTVVRRDGAPDPGPVIGPDGGDIRGDLEAGIRKMRGGGRPLDQEWRVPMEEATRQDYGDVRLHVNEESDRLNTELGARAFTVGKDIFMKRREYRPGSLETKRLVFHEMVHVGHQTNRHSLGKIQRQLDLDKENWGEAKQVKKHASQGGSPIYFLYDTKKSNSDPKLVVKLVSDGPQQMLATEMMAALALPGAVRTKVVPYNSKSGKSLKTRIAKKTKEKQTKEEIDEPYRAFMVMEYAKDLTTLAGANLVELPEDEFATMVQAMEKTQFFYDLGRIHGADMYMGNEDRLRDKYAPAIKNVFVNKQTGLLLPIDLGLVTVSQDAATQEIPQEEGAPLPASKKDQEAKDWVNLTITGSFEKNREVPSKKKGRKVAETTHDRRGAAFFTPDFRMAVLTDRIQAVLEEFKKIVGDDLERQKTKEGEGGKWLQSWQTGIDWEMAEKRFQAGVHDAIDFYTSNASRWAGKVEDVKQKFDLGSDELKYLDAGVFALKDRYAQLIAAGHGDDDVRKHLAKEVESGQQLSIATLAKSEVVPTGTVQLPARASGSMTTSSTDTSSTATTSTTTPTVPTPTANAAQSPLRNPLRTGIPAIGGTFNPFVWQYSGMPQAGEPSKSQEEEKGAQGGQLWKAATLGGVQSGTRIVGAGRRGHVPPSGQDASATTTTTTTAPATTPLPSYPSTDIAATGGGFSPMPPAVVEHLMLLAQELAGISESVSEEEREKEEG